MSVVSSGIRNQILITQSTFTFNQQRDSSAFYLLYTFVCAYAFHNSDIFDDVKCLPGTRTALLKALEDWASALTTTMQPILWLHGPAGAGKTAIARSLAEKWDSISKLGAAFFFWRTDSGRSDEKRLIPTLAYQLALSIPPLRPYIEDQVHSDPTVFDKSLKHQLTYLILQPLSQMRQSHPDLDIYTLPRLIIIDGLDECGSLYPADQRIECQKRTLEILQQLAASQEIFPFKLLILSRTEYHLRQFFDERDLNGVTHRIHLDYSFSPEKDILVYVTHEFLWITTHHPHRHALPFGWPGTHIIHRIVNRAAGQFIYAATVMKFLRAPRNLPDQQLHALEPQLIFEGQSNGIKILRNISDNHTSPLAPLDDLYHQIISSAVDPTTALTAISFYLVHEMTFLYFDSRTLSLVDVEIALGLLPGSVHHSLSDFESLLNPAGYFNLEFHHTSFVDFLCDKSRSQNWYIDLKAETERFCLLDLRAFERSELTNLSCQESWFHCFCESLMNSELNVDIWGMLNASWNNMVSYSAGLSFFESMGRDAGDRYIDLLRAYGGKKHPNTNRQRLCQVLNDSMANFLSPLIEIYNASAEFYALFLLSIFDSGFNTSDDTSSRDWACRELKHALLRTIALNPSLMKRDNGALRIASHGAQPNISWLRSLVVSLFTRKYKIKDSNQPPDPMLQDDAALMGSSKLILDLLADLDRSAANVLTRRSTGGVERVVRGIAYSLSSQTVEIILDSRTYPQLLMTWLRDK